MVTPQEEAAAAARSLARRRRAAPTRPAGRLWRRLGLLVALVLVVGATQRGVLHRLGDRVFGAPVDWHSDYAMSNRVYDMIVSHRLTAVPRDCLLLNIHGGDPARATTMDVFERPTDRCMGPVASGKLRVLPKLFEMRVDRDSGRVESDSATPGVYRAVD